MLEARVDDLLHQRDGLVAPAVVEVPVRDAVATRRERERRHPGRVEDGFGGEFAAVHLDAAVVGVLDDVALGGDGGEQRGCLVVPAGASQTHVEPVVGGDAHVVVDAVGQGRPVGVDGGVEVAAQVVRQREVVPDARLERALVRVLEALERLGRDRHRRRQQLVVAAQDQVRDVGLDLLLVELDLVLATPLTVETRGMIGARELGRMRPSAYLVNLARGALVDQHALIDALTSGRIAGAWLDAFETEPLPEDDPLWRTPNLFVTPHCSYRSERVRDRVIEEFATNLALRLDDQPLVNTMREPALGY
ncbi:MAG: hypothetical protein EA416_12600 [Trueperaceae bacterium]|nr:MAG: hypothetical protein EA416_12600 [Trueperaceae bacterium]